MSSSIVILVAWKRTLCCRQAADPLLAIINDPSGDDTHLPPPDVLIRAGLSGDDARSLSLGRPGFLWCGWDAGAIAPKLIHFHPDLPRPAHQLACLANKRLRLLNLPSRLLDLLDVVFGHGGSSVDPHVTRWTPSPGGSKAPRGSENTVVP